jgi:hypothetical protein
MKQWGLTILTLCMGTGFLLAQGVKPQLWLKATGQLEFGKHVVSAECIVRQQSAPGSEHPMPWEDALMRGFRLWYGYQLHPRWKVEAAPFTWMENTTSVQPESRFQEYRTAVYMNWNSKSDVWKWMVRSGIELRYMDLPWTTRARWREKVGLRYAFSSNIHLTVFDEVILPVYPVPVFEPEQNRIGLNFGFTPQKSHLTLDATAMAIKRPGNVPCEMVIGLGVLYHLKPGHKA